MSDTTNEISESNASIGREEIMHRFGFHPATFVGPAPTAPIHDDVRALFIELGLQLDQLVPAGRTKNAAFTKLQDAAMWFNWAIAETAPLMNADLLPPRDDA